MTASCNCTEPCKRTLYEPSIASIGLKASSLDNLLYSGVESFKAKTRAVKNLKFRVDGEYFQDIAGSVLNVLNGYKLFLNATKKLTSEFAQQVGPTRGLARALYNEIFDKDLNAVLFGGLTEGQFVINTLFSPLKTSLPRLLDRIRLNTNMLAMYVWQTGAFRSAFVDAKALAKAHEITQQLDEITFGMGVYPVIAYNVSMVSNYFKWNTSSYTFFPRVIIKGNACAVTFSNYANISEKMKVDVQRMADLVNGSSDMPLNETAMQVAFGHILRSINSFQEFETAFNANCLDTYDNYIRDYIVRRDKIKYEVNRLIGALTSEYDYDMDSVVIEEDKNNILKKVVTFVQDANMTAFELAASLGKENTTAMTTKIQDTITKITLQTRNSLRTAYFNYRGSVINSYVEMLQEICVFQDFMSPGFVESRISQLSILRMPIGNPDDLSITFSQNTSDPKTYGLMKQICSNKSVIPLVQSEISETIDKSFGYVAAFMRTYDLNLTKEQGILIDEVKEMSNAMATISDSYFAMEDAFIK